MEHRGKNSPDAARTAGLAAGAGVLGVLLLAVLAVRAPGALADGPVLAIDVDPSGNTPTTLGVINTCVSVAQGDALRIDVVVQDVVDLLAWEAYVKYDPAILRVTERDVRPFQQANSGSSVYDLSERVPDEDGVYRASAADTAFPPAPDTGSGVLFELTLTAIGPGTSDLALVSEDLDGDGKPDRGPFLRDVDGVVINDSNSDTFFDGEMQDAKVAVGEPCPAGSQEGTATTGQGGSGGLSLIYVVGPAIAGATLALAGGYIFLTRRRARSDSRNRASDRLV